MTIVSVHFLDEIVRVQKRGEARGITSICSAHPVVLEAVFRHALHRFIETFRLENGQRADPIATGEGGCLLQFGILDVGVEHWTLAPVPPVNALVESWIATRRLM